MYLILATFALCFSYFIIAIIFSLFFKNEFPVFTSKSFRSVSTILIASVITILIAISIPDPELSNRILHGLAGGFMAFFVCFLVVRDYKTPISTFQFFIFSALMVTALGVVNELAEFFIQHYTPFFHIVFSASPLDTWLDLVSNTVGILVAAVCFVPFINKNKQL